jgi:serine/threonine protein kinase
MNGFSATFSKDVVVKDGKLHLRDEPIERFEITDVLGDGANGVVLDARHRLLNQPRAVKVWMKLRDTDKRDKVRQGIEEAQKLAASDPKWVAMVYDAEVEGGFLYSSMERIYGHTLANELKGSDNLFNRWCLAAQYIDAIQNTTTETVHHGDAHPGNVMVIRLQDQHGSYTKTKLLDFGTSLFAGKEASESRHWRVVYKTFTQIIEPFKSKDWAMDQTVPFATREGTLLRCAYFKDVLDGLGVEAGTIRQVYHPPSPPINEE